MGASHSRRDDDGGDAEHDADGGGSAGAGASEESGGGISNPNDADDASRFPLLDATGRTLSMPMPSPCLPLLSSSSTPYHDLTSSSAASPMPCSPMISAPRVVALPDLDARDRERQAVLDREEARRERRHRRSHGSNRSRRRSVSLGDERDGEGGRAGSAADGGEALDERTHLLPYRESEVRFKPVPEGGGGHSTPGDDAEDGECEEDRRRKRLVTIKSGVELKDSGRRIESTSTGSLTSLFSLGRGESSSSGTPSPTPSYMEAFAKESNPVSMSILYGIINAAICLPVEMSFGSIIYQDDAFRPYLPVLVKLTVVSAIVHQVCFSTFSSLPFAVGQVQDAGLIFLSAMTTDIVKRCRDGGHSDEELLATVTVGLSLFTAALGFALIVVGRCRLASYVQLLPTPVVGGYLAFIGFFCGQSGMGLMAGVNVSGVSEWGALFADGRAKWVVPGIVGGFLIYVAIRTLKHFSVLPACIVILVSAFYAVLAITGTTVEEAREGGWISDADPPPVWYHTWDYLRPSKVVWSTLPHQTLTVLSMIFVVALSSSLDVAAIELEVGRPLDYNRELRTVGLSNAISGLTGGYTGSYIFSQSIFSLRAGIRSRLSGYVIALCELVTVVLPVSVLSYVPNFFFGSLLVMIAVDLCYEWLYEVRTKVTSAEYFVALGTFVLIQLAGVEYGILLGIALHVVLGRLGFEMSPPSGGGGGGGGTGSSPKQSSPHGEDDGDKRAPNGAQSPTSSTKKTLPLSESGGSLGGFVDYGGVSSDAFIEDDNDRERPGEEDEDGTTHMSLMV